MNQRKYTVITDKGDYKLIEQYWLLPDGTICKDVTTNPSRWMREYQLIKSQRLILDDCPDEVKKAFYDVLN